MAISSAGKLLRGRPRVDAIPVNTRFPPEELERLDAWIAKQKEALTRPQAIRRLVEIGLSADHRSVEQLHEAKTHADLAAELATEIGLKATSK